MFVKVAISLLFLVVAGDASNVNIVLSARGLPNMDNIGRPEADPFVKVLSKDLLSPSFVLIDTTSTISNENNPHWDKVFKFNSPGNFQKLRFELWDDDFFTPEAMGSVEVDMRAIAESCGTFEVKIDGCPRESCGSLIITRQLNGEVTPGIDGRFLSEF